MTGESGITTLGILSNVSDEDLSVVSGDTRTRSQCEGNCIPIKYQLSTDYSHVTELKRLAEMNKIISTTWIMYIRLIIRST